MNYTYNVFNTDVKLLAEFVRSNKQNFKGIYPIPNGGIPVALALSAELSGLPVFDTPGPGVLVVDDIVDSGKTISYFKDQGFTTLSLHISHTTPESCYPDFYCSVTHEYVDYWWETMKSSTSSIEDHVVRILQYIGEDSSRPGLIDTPGRVARMWKEFFVGYKEKALPRLTIVPNGEDGVQYDEMLKDEGYFFSFCEHHMVPFFGRYFFGYIPDKKILGASKIGRLVDYYSGRLQIAERLVNQIINKIEEVVQPHGSIMVMNARHLCKEMRGLKKWESPYEAIATRGIFRINQNGCKDEFMSRIG